MTDARDTDRTETASGLPRRRLLARVSAGILLPALGGCAGPAVGADARSGRLTLTIGPGRGGAPIGPGYAGFSYEKISLRTGFFSASNRPLIRLLRRLGPGLLRLGGNSVDHTAWRGDDAAGPGAAVGGADVEALAGFLRETGWQVIYGINLATNSPGRAGDEAAYAARSLGGHLYAFEIGNEPDAYSFNGLRPPSYGYRDFLAEWNVFAAALRRAAPKAVLSGPASAWHETSWTVPFARDEGRRIGLLTQHYYRANGLAPQSTLALLLAGDPALPGLLDPLWQASRMAGIAGGYRLTEANSFYDGGAPHISDTFGAALWTIDFLFETARHGASGVNFHGGGASPGYTPIADDGRAIIQVRPEYYAMLLFSMMGAGRLIPVGRPATALALSAYAIASRGRRCVMLVNKEPSTTIDVTVMTGLGRAFAEMTMLTAPALDSLTGMTLNGAAIAADGRWLPHAPASAPGGDGNVRLAMGPASAALVVLTDAG